MIRIAVLIVACRLPKLAHHVIHGDETNSVAVRAVTDITGPAGGFASVASDPKETLRVADYCIAKGLFDHLVGGSEQRGRHG